jgi:hypothetical protein
MSSTESKVILAGADSWQSNGLVCYRTGSSTNTFVHLIRLTDGNVEKVFSKPTSRTVKPPICLSTCVVLIDSSGTITKLDLNGKTVFEGNVSGIEGAVAQTGRLDDKEIYLVEVLRDNKNTRWVHSLTILDLSAIEPVVRERHDIIQPHKVTTTSEEVIVIGHKDVQRIKISK